MFNLVACDLCGRQVREILASYCAECDTLQCDKCMCECRLMTIEEEQYDTYNPDSE